MANNNCWSSSTNFHLPPVYIASNEVQANHLISKYFPRGSVIGFDIEWKPSGWPPGAKPHPDNGLPALVQLALPNVVVIVQLLHCQPRWPILPHALKTLLDDANTVFIGVQVHDDVALLTNGCPIAARCLDLHWCAFRSGLFGKQSNTQMGLAKLTLLLGGPELKKPKTVKLSNWASKSLTYKQQNYAALDAYAGGWIAARLWQSIATTIPFSEWIVAESHLPLQK